MKILLVQPQKPHKALGGEDLVIYEPLALEYLAAGVAGDHDVRILDMRIDHDLGSHLRDFQPDVVGITSYTLHVNTVKRLFQETKTFNPEIVTVVGGHHATVMPEDFYTPFINAIIVGEGVFPFRDLIVRLEKKMELSGIRGAICLENGSIVIHQPDHDTDLDAFPFPRRDLTGDYRKSYFSEWMRPLASIRTSRGCFFKCKFCSLWKVTGGRYLTRKPERLIEELGEIEEKYVYFADDESLLDARRMKEFADLIQRAGIRKRFFLYGRSDTIAHHPELIEQWKKVGLERIFIGLDFFRDADMKLLRKGSTVEDGERALQILKGLDINIMPMFIIRPEFDGNDFAELRKYCLDLDLDFIGFSVLTPLPGTNLYDEVKDKLITSNYDFCDFFHTHLRTTLPVKDFYRELAILYKSSRSLKNQIKFMRKFRIRELPWLFRTQRYFLERVMALGQDYADDSGLPHLG